MVIPLWPARGDAEALSGPHMKHKAVCLPLAGTGARGRGVVSRDRRENWPYAQP